MRSLLAAALAAGCLLAAACGGATEESTPAAAPEPAPELDDAAVLGDVATFGDLDRSHARGALAYDQWPPVGGPHNPEWQTCGRYEVAIAPERAVHALEHGAVWIAHDPTVDVAGFRDLVDQETHLLMSPVEDLPAPIVLSAWGAQLTLDTDFDPRVIAFIREYIRQGPEDAPCDRGGVGVPPDEPGPPLEG